MAAQFKCLLHYSWTDLDVLGFFVSFWQDEVDIDAQIVLRQQLVFVVPLERGRGVVDESVGLERVGDEFGVEGNVGQTVAVLDTAHQLGPRTTITTK